MRTLNGDVVEEEKERQRERVDAKDPGHDSLLVHLVKN